jgi:hypothetical protein
MASFTTWAALKAQMLDDLANQNLAGRDLTQGTNRIVSNSQAEWAK